jgi:radical SAM protein with 4Fe4S-binding SPASM domain
MTEDDLTHSQMRECIGAICSWAVSMFERGIKKEVLTVDNHADAVYIYLNLRKTDPKKAEEVLKLLGYNKGNASGIAIANVDNLGFVHADQFWQSYTFGNVKERQFGEIWMDTKDEVMAKLKNRIPHIKGRCAKCSFLRLCNANFRVRAEAVYHDMWREDPACYLTDEEITDSVKLKPQGEKSSAKFKTL